MLPKSIASCSFSGMILGPHYYFQGQKGPIYQGQKGPIYIFIAHIVHLFIQNLFSKYFVNWHAASLG